MNKIWSLLGIEPTNDKRMIREAFAAQSRLHHPEEEPEYFAELNQAYKAALKYGAEETHIWSDRIHGAGSGRVQSGGFRDRTDENTPVDEVPAENVSGADAPADEVPAENVSGEDVPVDEVPVENASGADAPADEMPAENASEDDAPTDDAPANSLLKLLDEAEERAIESSRQEGALRDFIALFENPKQAKQADTWKRFFLSETFLGEQYSERFGKGLLAYLSEQTVCPCDNLPMGLLQELAIAYALVPHFAGEEYFDGLKYPKEWYKVSVENTFPARRYVAQVFNMQGRECDLKSMTGRMLRQPANKVRHNAFSDYLSMKEMSREGRLTEREKGTWGHVLGFCQVCYLYERNGKRLGGADYESRSECVVKLYVQWLKDERLPESVLEFFYKKLAFKDLEHSSAKGLYGALKQEVLRQLPEAEELLFGTEGKEQLITKLYRICSSIINDNQNNYDRFIYGETPDIRERTRAFFALPEWERYKWDRELFSRIYKAAKRLVMPATMAAELIRHLSQGDFPEPERTELIESLLRSLATERMCRELDYRCVLSIGDIGLEQLESNSDFWQYYLMRGFGYRYAKVRGDWERGFIYEREGRCYLPAYINYIYAPSKAWQKRFVGFDEEREEISFPVSAVCPMPGARSLRVEFHYHYCLYFVDGEQLDAPVMAFSDLRSFAADLEKPEAFFFLLAVTAIEAPERREAAELIGQWLGRIPLHPFLVPRVAEMLASDNDRVPVYMGNGIGETLEGGAFMEDFSGSGGTAGAYGREAEKVETVLYGEQERFCFRVLVSKSGMSVWRQTDYGWQDRIFRRAEFGWQEFALPFDLRELADRDFPENLGEDPAHAGRAKAADVLKSLRQPEPICRMKCSLEGMEPVQKAEKILEIMGFSHAMEGYCVLRYGQREKRHDRVFYGVRAPFGFDLNAHSAEYVRSRNYLMSVSDTKIKERKILIGRFGWGFKYSPSSDYGPMYVYQGESGRFYAYGAIRMHRADSLTELLADFFQGEWEGATEAQAYEGCLTVSRLDHRLEYCYTPEDLRQSMRSPGGTAADGFTLFGGYGMWEELARWMDGAFAEGLPEWVNAVVVGIDWERGGALTLAGIHEGEEPENDWEEMTDEEYEDFHEPDGEEGDGETEGNQSNETKEKTYFPQVPLLVWAKGMDIRDRRELLVDALRRYADCGRFAQAAGDRSMRILIGG